MDWESKDSIQGAVAEMRDQILTFAALATISQQQEMTVNDHPVKGPVWVSNFTIPPPEGEDQVRTILLRQIDELNEENASYKRPQSEPLNAQWTGYRSCATKDALEPSVSEKEKYTKLMEDVSSPVVVFFIYGGAFYTNGPASYRKILARLAQMTGGRCMTVRQRLAPQYPFPAALLDVFHGYISLLAPPPGSPHEGVPASSIVLAGDSSGACLALGLLQILLRFRRQNVIPTIEYHGRQVELVLPAGLTLLSAVGDLTNGLPSYKSNAAYDFFPPGLPPTVLPGFPTCKLWPSNPPRGNIYCDAPMLHHPLCSPAASKDWTGSPPMWFASGQEQIVDGVKLIAQTAFSQGVTTVLQEYGAMPHIFMWRFAESPQARKCWTDWANACKALAEGRIIHSSAVFVEPNGLAPRELDPAHLTSLSTDTALDLMKMASRKFKVFDGPRTGDVML